MAIMFMDHAPNVAATIIILVTISLVVFPLRVYARLKYEAWGRDDWCMTAAFVSSSVIPLTLLIKRC
jgi:hypothetical protein